VRAEERKRRKKECELSGCIHLPQCSTYEHKPYGQECNKIMGRRIPKINAVTTTNQVKVKAPKKQTFMGWVLNQLAGLPNKLLFDRKYGVS